MRRGRLHELPWPAPHTFSQLIFRFNLNLARSSHSSSNSPPLTSGDPVPKQTPLQLEDKRMVVIPPAQHHTAITAEGQILHSCPVAAPLAHHAPRAHIPHAHARV